MSQDKEHESRLSSLVDLADGLISTLRKPHAQFLQAKQFHGFESLTGFCEECGIRLVLDRPLPYPGVKGLSINVLDTPHIIIDPSLRGTRGIRAKVLAHEIAHVILGHLVGPAAALCGTGETIDNWAPNVQVGYLDQVELEANLLAMYLMFPDRHLHEEVNRSIFIRTRIKAQEHHLDVSWLTARIRLYRLKYGYKNSIALLRRKHRSGICCSPDEDSTISRWISQERAIHNSIEKALLPDIDVSKVAVLAQQVLHEIRERKGSGN